MGPHSSQLLWRKTVSRDLLSYHRVSNAHSIHVNLLLNQYLQIVSLNKRIAAKTSVYLLSCLQILFLIMANKCIFKAAQNLYVLDQRPSLWRIVLLITWSPLFHVMPWYRKSSKTQPFSRLNCSCSRYTIDRRTQFIFRNWSSKCSACGASLGNNVEQLASDMVNTRLRSLEGQASKESSCTVWLWKRHRLLSWS